MRGDHFIIGEKMRSGKDAKGDCSDECRLTRSLPFLNQGSIAARILS